MSMNDDIFEEDELCHYGTPRHSGRYPWGSGNNPYQRTKSWYSRVQELKKQGVPEKTIAESFGMSTTELRNRYSAERAHQTQSRNNQVWRMHEAGMSNMAIARELGVNESNVRKWLEPHTRVKAQLVSNTTDALRNSVEEKGLIDVGRGVERYLGVSQTKLNSAVQALKDEGYVVTTMHIPNVTNAMYTDVKILAPKGTTTKYIYDHLTDVNLPFEYSQDGGKTFYKKEPINNIDGSRVHIRYAEDGGLERDGTIELKRGVEDLSLGQAHYAQVRIGVDGTHYLKGMAIYGKDEDFPEGCDIIFNTNKHKGTPAKDVFKPQEGVDKKTGERTEDPKDPSNPFGASLKSEDQLTMVQRHYTDADGNTHLSPLNIVNEEGAWGEWKKSLASQMLSKQDPQLAKRQLSLAYDFKKQEFDDIMALDNPVVQKKLLESFADKCDSDAVDLKAAALPRQKAQVILPFPEIKEGEIYATNYRDGEEVILIRYPHGGVFEIPRLTVNNSYKTAQDVLGSHSKDAVGINAKTAEILSGADFDGDTVLVIPTAGYNLKNASPLEGLKNFDPKESYPEKEGMKYMTKKQTQIQMGMVTNLITDMTLKGATDEELAAAVRHSMVVIDANKHKLDYTQSEIDNGIATLKEKYQPEGGPSTIISRAKNPTYVTKRKAYYKIDPETGEKIFMEADDARYTDKKGNEKTKTTKSTKMYEAKDAYELSSGLVMENVYADYANNMKALGNQARKASLTTGTIEVNPVAKQTYANEVASLDAKLNTALKNAPLERQARLVANKQVQLVVESDPTIKDDKDRYKKVKNIAMADARAATGAKKELIDITDKEWEAIQSGAVSATKLSQILDNADEARVKELATPREYVGLTPAKQSMAKQLLDAGYTQDEVASRLGVSTTTINKYV